MQGNFHIAFTKASALFGACQHKGFLFVNKSLYTFWLRTCALSFRSQKDSLPVPVCVSKVALRPLVISQAVLSY